MDKRILTHFAIAGMLAGTFAVTACESSTASKKESETGIAAAKTLAAFQAECTEAGGTYKAHDCQGMNDCKGQSYQEGKGVSQNECKGHSACQGGSCLEA